MIDNDMGLYRLYCDHCEDDAEEIFDDFHEAVNYKKEYGWKSVKGRHDWFDLCPQCQTDEIVNKYRNM